MGGSFKILKISKLASNWLLFLSFSKNFKKNRIFPSVSLILLGFYIVFSIF